ncbi:hypothetical protein OOJ91_33860 [Micromonospora lupini]|uniref:hypothetical protein n=1 Tax=Micromonospora lupini TaxID=285679 RepID=UPI0022568DEF|nr:hypothetical protein [Micromonospora lupini]MCX5070834.1 hypothetical protein [Micromonospora lupini]
MNVANTLHNRGVAIVDLDRRLVRSQSRGRSALTVVLAAGAFALLAVAPEHRAAAEENTTSIVIVAQPADRAAAAIHLADGSTESPPIGREVILAEPPASVQVLLFGQDVTDPVSCAIVIDGQVLDQSGPAGVASCQWDGPGR